MGEQESLGVLGVNLVYGAFLQRDPEALMKMLMEGLSRLRVDIDMIKFSGPAFTHVDNRLASLQLVELGLTDATMFTAQGDVVQPAEVLYEKPVLIFRGRFRPITNVGIDMLDGAAERFRKIPGVNVDPVVIMGMTLRDLDMGHGVDPHDFLARADMLAALGKTVMVSNFRRFDSVTSSLRRYTHQWLGFVMGVPTLRAVFDEQYYTNLPGGILEGLGRLVSGKCTAVCLPHARQHRRQGGDVHHSGSRTPTATPARLPARKGRDRGHRELRLATTSYAPRRSLSRHSKGHAELGTVPARASGRGYQAARVVWIPSTGGRSRIPKIARTSLWVYGIRVKEQK